MKPMDLPPFGKGEFEINVVVETPKGSGNKFKYDLETGLYMLAAPMPEGFTFPFEFGFIPSTLGEDGDPIDVLILMNSPTFVGCVMKARLLGVIEAEQKEANGEKERNDRLVAVPTSSRLHEKVTSIEHLPSELLWEIEHFFKSYNSIRGKEFVSLGNHGPKKAMQLVKEGEKAARQKQQH